VRLDILAAVGGEAMTVVCAFRDEALDADTVGCLLVEWGTEIVVAMPDPANPKSRGVRVRGCG
jgi:hypothetical protein